MNLTSLLVETERKVRFLERTQHLINGARRQRIRTAEVQSSIFVRQLLARTLKGVALRAQNETRAARTFERSPSFRSPSPARAAERVRECTWTANTRG
jgi:hypothetical protein